MEKQLHIADTNFWQDVLSIIDSLPFYVILVDERHYILQTNRAVQEHLGVNREEIIGQYCPKAIHGIEGPFYGCPLEESVETGRPVEREVLDKESGRWLNSAIYPTEMLTEDGRQIFFHMVTDISDHKQEKIERCKGEKYDRECFAERATGTGSDTDSEQAGEVECLKP